MGKLENAIKALQNYEKHPNDQNKTLAAMASLALQSDLQLFSELSLKFTTRINAENLGWLVVEELED